MVERGSGVGHMSEAIRGAGLTSLAPGYGDPSGEEISAEVRLGHEIRFALVAVGGGAVRIAQAIAQRRLRHLETIAINCDPSVQGFEEFDRRIYLGSEGGAQGDTGGSPFIGRVLARAGEPVLRRVFDETHFVTIVGSLGGGAGTGVLPQVLELASQRAAFVSAFVIKPFVCEGDRRAVAERTVGRIHLLERFGDLRSQGRASLHVLDNEALVGPLAASRFRAVSDHWARTIGNYVKNAYLDVAESYLAAARAAAAIVTTVPAAGVPVESAIAPPTPERLPAPLGPIPVVAAEAELTIEIDGADLGGPNLP